MNTRIRSVLVSAVLPWLLTSAGSLIISALPKKGFASTQKRDLAVTVKDWTAAGSGCRAQMKKAGDVELHSVRSESSGGTQLIIIKFQLPKYKLSSPPENPATSMTFARECALRVVAQPNGKMRVRSIAARTPIQYSKDAPVGLKLQYLLRLDGEIVGQHLKEVEPGQEIRNAEDIVVTTGKPSEDALAFAKMNPATCGSPHMLGFDYTFIAARKERADAAHIQISEDKQLELAVEMEPCPK